MMITLEANALTFRFPEVHDKASCRISFQRTLRIPDDGKDYPLPPGLGEFPLRHLDDFENGVLGEWSARGGVVYPMYQSEAMWLNFGGGRWSSPGRSVESALANNYSHIPGGRYGPKPYGDHGVGATKRETSSIILLAILRTDEGCRRDGKSEPAFTLSVRRFQTKCQID